MSFWSARSSEGRSRLFVILKTDAVPPTAIANMSTAAIEKPGWLIIRRRAELRSWRIDVNVAKFIRSATSPGTVTTVITYDNR